MAANAAAAPAGGSAALTKADYQNAERFLSYKTDPLVDHDVRKAHWFDDSQFWFVDTDHEAQRYMRMDAASGKAEPLFDQAKLAAALNAAMAAEAGKDKQHKKDDKAKPLEAGKLPISDIKLPKNGHIQLTVKGSDYSCDYPGLQECVKGVLSAVLAGNGKKADIAKLHGVISPDGKQVAFIRDWNLWVRDIASGKERQLTKDGVKDFGYATDNAGWVHSEQAVLEWSPDSKRIATFQQDQRKVADMALVSTALGNPKIDVWKYPLAGDKHVFMIHRVVIDVAAAKVVPLKMKPDFHRSTLCDDISCSGHGAWDDVKWAPDSQSLAFVSTSRDHKHEWLRIADPKSGKVRTAFEESVPSYFESGIEGVSWRYLPGSDQALWYSERSDWGQLYLYSTKTGKVLHPVTSGEGAVSNVLHLDPKSREVWYTAVGKVKGNDPYYRQLWKASLDGGEPVLLTPENADHSISLSKDGSYFVDSYSTPTTPPVTVLRAAKDGHVISTVAKADISRLKAAGWVAPEPIIVTGRDGKTPLYGLMFKPSNFDPKKRYPIIDYVYPGPQTGSVRGRSFLAARSDHQAMAELGFIVVAIDGMGTPWRSKSFHDTWYGNMGDNTLPDQVKAIRELANRYPWIDFKRVGIWGHSGGGNTTADAMFRYPELFKVGWAESGNHDNRNYEADWGEKYQGLVKDNADGTSNYDNQANQDLVAHLQGKLMLTYGTLDDNVPPQNTELLVQALIKADKPFDMIAVPNAHHAYGYATPYITKRRWDYFVQHLLGATPAPYQLKEWPWH
ncbi:DPP IV N-terminal domain-containing protein [Gallaecimonas kandeliae]|nr:S9 family peptidase [Gallaecimonas kandeliae]WKE67518.1 DPP IV N-terminal domain-containing protein [Gallaecimonas kandeliae]